MLNRIQNLSLSEKDFKIRPHLKSFSTGEGLKNRYDIGLQK
jgi:hypothetical protein